MLENSFNVGANTIEMNSSGDINLVTFNRQTWPNPQSTIFVASAAAPDPSEAVQAMLRGGLFCKIAHAYSGKGSKQVRSTVVYLGLPNGIAEPAQVGVAPEDPWLAPMSAHLVLKAPANVIYAPLRAEVMGTMVGMALSTAFEGTRISQLLSGNV